MSHSTSPLWNFVRWDSIWPLPHVILAYHAYLYTRNWISVLCFYYLLKTVQLLLFSILGIGYDHYFAEMLNSRELAYYRQSHSFSPQDSEDGSTTQDYACLVDFNGLFVGGTIQTLLGIMLGMVHSYLYAPYTHNTKYFYPVTFWKCPATKHQIKFMESKAIVERQTKVHNVLARYGLWPWHLWIGYKNQAVSGGIKGWTSSDKDKDMDNKDNKVDFQRHLQKRWRFRYYFWQRWIQLTFLGTPCLLFYTIDGEHVLRVGSVAYGFITCSLLLWYRLWNEKYFIRKLTKKTSLSQQGLMEKRVSQRTTRGSLDVAEDRGLELGLGLGPGYGSLTMISSGNNLHKNLLQVGDILYFTLKYDVSLIFNSYDTIYSAWILTCVALIGFQSFHIPPLTAFYKVILSSLLVASASLMFSLLSKIPKRNFL